MFKNTITQGSSKIGHVAQLPRVQNSTKNYHSIFYIYKLLPNHESTNTSINKEVKSFIVKDLCIITTITNVKKHTTK